MIFPFSTSGIGLGIATSLAEAGANLAINGFGPDEEIQKILASLRAKNVKGKDFKKSHDWFSFAKHVSS